MRLLFAYTGSLVAMALLDAAWLSTMVPMLYRPRLGALLLPRPVWWAAISFYLLYGAGVVLFAILPALKAARCCAPHCWAALSVWWPMPPMILPIRRPCATGRR